MDANDAHIRHLSHLMMTNRNVVFVVGAGASSGMPLAEQLKAQLIAGIETELAELVAQRYAACLQNGAGHCCGGASPSESLLKKASLEMVGSAYAEHQGMDNLLELLRQGLGSKEKPPPLGYEILSHFLSHGLVNAVISLNFDELIEAAVDDEIGLGGVDIVANDYDFERVQRQAEEGPPRAKKIIYKPHGTLTYPSSMRAAFEQVLTLPPKTGHVLQRCLRSASAIVFVGYAANDPDVSKLLDEITCNYERPVFWVKRSPPSPDSRVSKYLKDFRKSRLIQQQSDDFFISLADRVGKFPDESRRIPAITRHKLRSWFFERGADFKLAQKLESEILLDAIKARGLISARALAECRRLNNYANALITKGGSLLTILDLMVQKGILQRSSQLEHPAAPLEADEYAVAILQKSRTGNYEVSEDGFDKLHRFFGLRLSASPEDEINRLNILINDLATDFDIEIVQSPAQRCLLPFFEPEPIVDLSDLRERTRRVLELAQGHELLVASERAEWLTREPFRSLWQELRRQGTEITVIISKRTGPPGSAYEFQQSQSLGLLRKLRANILYFPPGYDWCHMTLASRVSEGAEGIYFERRGRAVQISPYYVGRGHNAEADSRRIRGIFDALRSISSPEQGGQSWSGGSRQRATSRQ